MITYSQLHKIAWATFGFNLHIRRIVVLNAQYNSWINQISGGFYD